MKQRGGDCARVFIGDARRMQEVWLTKIMSAQDGQRRGGNRHSLTRFRFREARLLHSELQLPDRAGIRTIIQAAQD